MQAICAKAPLRTLCCDSRCHWWNCAGLEWPHQVRGKAYRRLLRLAALPQRDPRIQLGAQQRQVPAGKRGRPFLREVAVIRWTIVSLRLAFYDTRAGFARWRCRLGKTSDTGCTTQPRPPGPKASGAALRPILYAPFTSALINRPSLARNKPREMRLPA